MDRANWFSTPGPVAAVSPADLRKVWDHYEESEKRRGPNVAIGFGVVPNAYSPEGNAYAVFYRVWMLKLLKRIDGRFSQYLHDGTPEDRVFEAAASFPMEKMLVGSRYQELPLDVEEFLRQLESR